MIPGGYVAAPERITREQALQSVGAGWAGLVHRAYDFLEETPARVAQVKEKFGTLRINFDVDVVCWNKVYEFVMAIEAESLRTCEDCGQPGQEASIGGWVRTLCPICIEQASTPV